MKENAYDDAAFFAKYSRFPRSVEGLRAAGEWHALRDMLPDFAGKRVLDIGCGFGWHCIYAAEQGAARVVGTDISERMLAVARERTPGPNVEYRRVAMEDLDDPAASYDVVLSSLAFHYTPDFRAVCGNIHRMLADGGDFVFSAEHPVFTSAGPQDWMYGTGGQRICWPVDRYFEEGAREASFLGERVTKYHRTLSSYLSALLDTGFAITGLVEPLPDPELLARLPELADELRRPMMLLVSAKK